MEQLNNKKSLKEVRKELRNNPTQAESLLWKNLKGKKLMGKKFRRQHSFGDYIMDFYCPEEKLAVELDGAPHFTEEGKQADQERDAVLDSYGIQVLRFENKEVMENMHGVLGRIKEKLTSSKTTPPPETRKTTPQPPPETGGGVGGGGQGYKYTKLGWIPEEWEVVRLGNKTQKVGSGKTPKGGEAVYKQAGRPLIRSQNVGWGQLLLKDIAFIDEELHNTFKSTEVQKGDVLLNITGASIGRCALVSEELIGGNVNQHVCIVRTEESVQPLFLVYYLLSSKGQNQINSFQAGGNRQGLNFEQIRSFPIPLPPLPEQQKIAQILSTWDMAIQKTEQLIAKKQERKKGLMQQLLTGKKRFGEFVKSDKMKETKLGWIPEDWEEITFSKIADKEVRWSITGGPFGSDLKSDDFTKSGVRILQLQNLGDGRFLDNYRIYTSEEKADKLIACNIYPGEIILSKMGDPVARACVIPSFAPRFLMASDGIRLVPDKSAFDSRFVLEYINYSIFRRLAIRHSTGSTRQRIGLSDLKKLPFIRVCLREQQKIASVLSAADQEILGLQNHLDKIKEQKKGLMQKLLTGEVRVKIG